MYTEMAEQNARELIGQHGQVREVNLKPNGEVEAVFASGQSAVLGSLFRFGYSGTGSSCLAAWLRAAGFNVTMEQVAAMKAPRTLKK